MRKNTIVNLMLGWILSAGVWLMIGGAVAQDASTYYTVQHPSEFNINWAAFYLKAEAMTRETQAALPHHLDIPYGRDVKQRLDIYLPVKVPAHAPVLLFLHGGGFHEGDRAQYGFIARPFANHGVITVIASYRLTSAGFRYPDQPDDAKAALAWLYHHVAEYGGDPNRLFVTGHSAGAILAAELGADLGWMAKAGIPTKAFRGMFPVSGVYDLSGVHRGSEAFDYVPTPELARQASPLLHVVKPVPMAIVALGSADESGINEKGSQAFVDKLKAAGSNARVLVLSGADHAHTVLALGDERSVLFQAVMKAIRDAPADH